MMMGNLNTVTSERRDSEERYRALFNAIDEGFCIIELIFDDADRAIDYRFIEINPAFERHTGLQNAQGRRMRELRPLHDEHWFEIYGKVALTGEPIRFVNRAESLGRWFDLYAFRIGMAEERQVAVIFKDITEQRVASEALSEREEQLRLIFESATEYAIISSDYERRVTGWNSGAERLLGYPEDEMLGQSGDILFTPEDRARQAPQGEVRTAIENGRAVNERWHVRKDGSRFWGSGLMFPLRNDDGKPRGFLKIMRDRTAERRAEEELRNSEERLRVAVETAQLGTWVYEPPTGEAHIDNRTRELFGIPQGRDADYDACLRAVHPDDRARVDDRIQQVLRGANGGDYHDEYRIIDSEKRMERWIRAAGRVYFDEAKRPIRFVGSLLDVSDLVKAREVLTRRGEELERTVEERTVQLRDMVQQLETFSYSVVHDMRAPLRSVRSFANVLADDYGPKLDDTARGYLNRLKAAVERMDALITDVLTYSRVTSTEAELTEVNLDRLVHEIVEQYPQFQECTSCVEIRSPLPVVRGNRALLTQCISNLLGNALKFVAPNTKPQVVVSAESKDKLVRLNFQDNGIGIAPQFHHRIFGLFQRLHRADQFPGTGVGLAIVQKAVERMRGSVGFESQLGQGSRFWIEVPAAKEATR